MVFAGGFLPAQSAAGRNFGNANVVADILEHTSSFMPIRSASLATPTTLETMRTPSSRSICATLYGTDDGEARVHDLVHDRESVERATPAGGPPIQAGGETMRASFADRETPAAAGRQCCSISWPSRAPSKNGALISSGMGTGLPAAGILTVWAIAVWDIARCLLIDFGHAISLSGPWHPAERRRPDEGGVTPRSMPGWR